MALPTSFKLRLKGSDSNVMTLGFGPFGGMSYPTDGNPATISGYGPPTSCRSIYELFYPRGTYFLYTPATDYNGNTNGQWIYNRVTALGSAQNKLSMFPDQMTPFAYLYKYARVERVDFNFKLTNLGLASIIPSAVTPSNFLVDKHYDSSTLSHTLITIPKNQVDAMDFDKNSPQKGWSPGSKVSDSNAAQLAEMPGSARKVSSQDGNRETVYFTYSIDLTKRMAGDSIRQSTWMTALTDPDPTTKLMWNIPEATANDPQLVSIGTSPLIDERLQTVGALGNANENNVWFRYVEQVTVNYHITFWEPKTPVVDFSNGLN